jgi:alanyl aminopeptidase
MRSRLVAVPAAIFSFALLGATAEPSPELRLDDSVRPSRYRIELSLVPDHETFTGKTTIDVQLVTPKSMIWLNALGLTITEAGTQDQPAQVIQGRPGFVGLQFKHPLEAGRAQLRFTYSGRISRTASAGVFQLASGKNWYIYTQFEATDARRALPCFDQPNFKTPWDIALKVRSTDRAFANSPQVAETELEDGYKLVRFAITKPLPTYLVAFAVGPFEVVDIGKSASGRTPMRIIVPAGKTGATRSAAEQIPALLDLLEQYFGIPFPFEKLDSLVMPISNFAMENAGLITYSEGLLLAQPGSDTVQRRRLRAEVIAHEMAHQWFGDLVTTAWWNDIWLNEAFATWMEGKIVDRWKPAWRVDVEGVQQRLEVMESDSLTTARKVRQPIDSENDIANAFDGITYQKGAAVIRMFEHWLGEEQFRRGVQLYLKENAGRSATSRDFLAAISRAAQRDIAPAFSTFLDQPGAPVLSMDLLCDGGRPRIAMKQKRYVPIGSPRSGSPQLWSVPVCVSYAAGGKTGSQCQLLSEESGEMALEARSCPSRVDGNDGAVGYYRVAYSGALLKNILSAGASRMTAPEKVSLLGDLRALVTSGDVPPAEALSILPQFTKDASREVVESTTEIALLAVGRLTPEEVLPAGREYILELYGSRARRLGWTARASDSSDDELTRSALVPFVAVEGQDRQLIEEAGRLAREWLRTRSGVDRNVLRAVLETAARFGGSELFDEMLRAAKATKDATERQVLLDALGSFGDPGLARRAMGLLLTGDFDMRQAFYPLLMRPLRYRPTAELPFEFVRDNWERLIQALPHEVGSDYAAAIPRIGAGICDPDLARQYASFFENRAGKYTGAPRTFAQTRESIQLCIAQKKALGPGIAEFLKSISRARATAALPSAAQ